MSKKNAKGKSKLRSSARKTASKSFSHERRRGGGKDEWLTPRPLITALGEFDVDPCAPAPHVRPWPTAKEHYCKADDGLSKPWIGRAWVNPPYGTETMKWLARLKEHGNGIALVFARTETRSFFEHVWGEADGVLFVRGRLTFHHVDGSKASQSAGAPSCLIAYGEENARALASSGIWGTLIVKSGTSVIGPKRVKSAGSEDEKSAKNGGSSDNTDWVSAA